jgi:hypothetical protein
MIRPTLLTRTRFIYSFASGMQIFGCLPIFLLQFLPTLICTVHPFLGDTSRRIKMKEIKCLVSEIKYGQWFFVEKKSGRRRCGGACT